MLSNTLKGISIMSSESRRAIGNLDIQPRRTGFWQLHFRTAEHPAVAAIGAAQPVLKLDRLAPPGRISDEGAAITGGTRVDEGVVAGGAGRALRRGAIGEFPTPHNPAIRRFRT